MSQFSGFETLSPYMRFKGNALPSDILAQYFGVNPGIFAGTSFHDFADAQNFLEGKPNVSFTTPQMRGPAGSRGPNGEKLPPLTIPSLFSAALQDRDKAQALADKQYGKNEGAIEDFRKGVNTAADVISKKAEESQTFMRGQIDTTEQRNLDAVEGVNAQSKKNVEQAKIDEAKYLARVDKMVGRTESDLARSKKEYQDATAQSIQNQRRAADIDFGRQMEQLEATGRGASSTEVQQLKAQYTENLGIIASRAGEAYNNALASLNMSQDEQMRQMRTAATSMAFGAMQQTQGARSERLQSMASMAGLVASIGSTANEQRAAVESMYLQAETTAQQLRVNGLGAVADLIMRNVPVYLPISGVIAQVLAMKNSMYTGQGWGAISGGSQNQAGRGGLQFNQPPSQQEPEAPEGKMSKEGEIQFDPNLGRGMPDPLPLPLPRPVKKKPPYMS